MIVSWNIKEEECIFHYVCTCSQDFYTILGYTPGQKFVDRDSPMIPLSFIWNLRFGDCLKSSKSLSFSNSLISTDTVLAQWRIQNSERDMRKILEIFFLLLSSSSISILVCLVASVPTQIGLMRCNIVIVEIIVNINNDTFILIFLRI